MFGSKKQPTDQPEDAPENDEAESDKSKAKPSFRWRGRMATAIIMLLLGFLGLIITNTYPDISWIYWAILSVIYALLCIWLSIFLKRWNVRPGHSVWRDIVHWIALLVAVYLNIIQVNAGVIGTLEGGILNMELLALATFLGGIYIDATFILIGLTLAYFVIVISLIQSYLLAAAIPIVIIAAIIIIIVARYRRQRYN